MNYLLALMLATASIATNAVAEQLDYELEVNGMVCAFCAYNVSKQVRTLDGVVAETVDVDLEQGKVRLHSTSRLDRTRLADLLLDAGFTLGAVNETSATSGADRPQQAEVVVLSVTIDADEFGEGRFDEVLEAIGAIAERRSGRISATGPAEHELAILAPLLMGRQSVINANYDPVNRPDNTVIVSLQVRENTNAPH